MGKSKKAKHKSVSKEAKALTSRIERCPLVTKLVLGTSESCRHSFAPGKAKFQYETDAGFKLNLYTGNGVQNAFVVCDKKDMPAILEHLKDYLVQ